MNALAIALKKVQPPPPKPVPQLLSYITKRRNADGRYVQFLMLGIEVWAELYNLFEQKMPERICDLEVHVVPTLPPTAIVFGA